MWIIELDLKKIILCYKFFSNYFVYNDKDDFGFKKILNERHGIQ